MILDNCYICLLIILIILLSQHLGHKMLSCQFWAKYDNFINHIIPNIIIFNLVYGALAWWNQKNTSGFICL